VFVLTSRLGRLSIYSDGGARGNPGPAAAAYLILSGEGQVVKAESCFLGKRTNNQAEYEALIAALKAAVELDAKEAVCHLDSQLVCKHLTGEYRVKDPQLHKLWVKVQELKRCFTHIQFVNVPRTNQFIRQADFLVNQRLDEVNKRSV
jgi:ribonuclease HI